MTVRFDTAVKTLQRPLVLPHKMTPGGPCSLRFFRISQPVEHLLLQCFVSRHANQPTGLLQCITNHRKVKTV